MPYIGRFAPSPTGPLHMGSLIAAVASYLQARLHQGKWLVRIEDLDPPREVTGAADAILTSLDQFGFEWDEQVTYQSNRIEVYEEAVQQLLARELAYPCGCSRAEISSTGKLTRYGIRYAGTCRQGVRTSRKIHSIRLIVPDRHIGFTDSVQGHYEQNLLRDIGDFVIKRADGQIAYQLAVVIDDAWQSITEVVRGCDLLDSTPRQIYLQEQLAYASPGYAHIPVIINAQGNKLSKQTGARAIDAKSAGACLVHALSYLNQRPPASLELESVDTIWSWAKEHWQLQQVSQQRVINE